MNCVFLMHEHGSIKLVYLKGCFITYKNSINLSNSIEYKDIGVRLAKLFLRFYIHSIATEIT